MRSAEQILDADYLQMRCKLIDIAAILDRYQRSGGQPESDTDQRLAHCRSALAILNNPQPAANRAQQITELLSDPPLD